MYKDKCDKMFMPDYDDRFSQLSFEKSKSTITADCMLNNKHRT